MSLEILRDFVKKVVPPVIYLKNLIIDGIETPNKRLWTLREFLSLEEKIFAEKLNLDVVIYYQYEKCSNSISDKIV